MPRQSDTARRCRSSRPTWRICALSLRRIWIFIIRGLFTSSLGGSHIHLLPSHSNSFRSPSFERIVSTPHTPHVSVACSTLHAVRKSPRRRTWARVLKWKSPRCRTWTRVLKSPYLCPPTTYSQSRSVGVLIDAIFTSHHPSHPTSNRHMGQMTSPGSSVMIPTRPTRRRTYC